MIEFSLSLIEECMWGQKLREIWLKEENKNIKFFYKMANAWKNGNFLSKVKSEWKMVEVDFKKAASKVAQNLFYEIREGRPNNVSGSFRLRRSRNLELSFFAEEVLAALFSLYGDKALGIDDLL